MYMCVCLSVCSSVKDSSHWIPRAHPNPPDTVLSAGAVEVDTIQSPPSRSSQSVRGLKFQGISAHWGHPMKTGGHLEGVGSRAREHLG